MAAGLKGRIVALLAAVALVGGAVVIRVWLAATGGYSAGGLSISLRAMSAVALFAGLLLAALAVAWPMRKPGGPPRPEGG
ncbi:MAG: hypothetical protein HYU30_04065 [Chloroflexi bacterium]|nr:hypothetical protein [Chloroflexota bacterium]